MSGLSNEALQVRDVVGNQTIPTETSSHPLNLVIGG